MCVGVQSKPLLPGHAKHTRTARGRSGKGPNHLPLQACRLRKESRARARPYLMLGESGGWSPLPKKVFGGWLAAGPLGMQTRQA